MFSPTFKSFIVPCIPDGNISVRWLLIGLFYDVFEFLTLLVLIDSCVQQFFFFLRFD